MIQFSELRISTDGKKLHVDCHVENFAIYNSVYISAIYVDYYKNRLASGSPSEHAICLYDNTDGDASVRNCSVALDESQLEGTDFGTKKLRGGLFYVYVLCDANGLSLAAADCGWDSMTTMGIAADWKKIYDEGMMYIADVVKAGRNCGISDSFQDFILRWYAMRLGIETCDYDSVDKLWDGMFGGMEAHYNDCGCLR